MTYLWQTHDSFSSFAFQMCSEMACNRGQAYSPIPACLAFFPLLPPLLNIGIAFAILQSDGASPNSMELLKILVTRPAISCASSLRERGGEATLSAGLMGAMISALGFHIGCARGHVLNPTIQFFLWPLSLC